MKAVMSIWLALLLAALFLVAPPAARAQKSLSDGVEELASEFAVSFGDGNKGLVAIVPLRDLKGNENEFGTFIAVSLPSSLFRAGYRDIVQRQMLYVAIKELKLQFTGMIDPDSAKKIGKFLQAHLVVGCTMSDQLAEVVVLCQMFEAETGKFVAVADARFLKDDNVKTMLSAKAGEIEPTRPIPPSTSATRVVAGISFQIRACTRNGGVVICQLAAKALNKDLKLKLIQDYTSLKAEGAESSVKVKRLSHGEESHPFWLNINLTREVEEVANLRFEGIDTNARAVELIRIGFGGTSYDTVEFRGIVLEGGS